MRNLPPLRALRCFEATARLGSVVAAAQELGVSHSAVSQQIAVLDEYFGRKLLLRVGRGVTLAPEAQSLFEEVRLGFDRISIASERFAVRGSHRVVTVNSTPSFAMRWLIPRLRKFQTNHPRIEVRVATSPTDAISQLAEPYDVIIRREFMSRPEHGCIRFLEDVSIPVASQKLLGRHQLRKPADVRQMRLLHLKSRPDAWRTWFDLNGVKGSPKVPGASFDHFFLSVEAAINGLGIALCPRTLIESDLASGILLPLCALKPVVGPGFHALHRNSPVPERQTSQFIDWLVSEGALHQPD